MKSSASRTFFFLLFAFAGMQLSAQAVQHTVTLICDASRLSSDGPVNACYFEGAEDQNPEDYTIVVEVGDEIFWQGADSSGENTIAIRKIKYERGTNVFNRAEINGNGTVTAVAERRSTEGDYKYKISFKVNNTGRTYDIDPKIQVR